MRHFSVSALFLVHWHMRAREGLFGDAPPPPASLDADGPPQPPASLFRCLQQCFSNDFVSDSHVFLGFLHIFLDSLQDPIFFGIFFGFSVTCFNYICFYG